MQTPGGEIRPRRVSGYAPARIGFDRRGVSDTVSDMKTFNVRELSRSTAEVLEACEHDGGAIIQYQDGRQFELVPRGRRDAKRRALPDFAARQRATFGARKFSSAQINASLDAAKGRQ